MQSYRMYFIEFGHIRGADAFEAEDDKAAKAHAEAVRAGRAAELWNCDRIVRKYDPDANASTGG